MDTRLWDMLSLILQEIIDEDRDLHEDAEALRKSLASRGYEEEEIETALGWMDSYLRAIPARSDVPWPPRRTSVPRGLRVLSFDEGMVVTPEAHGFLHGLEARGVVSPEIAEEILQRSLNMFDESVGLEEMKIVALLTVFEQGEGTVEDLLKLVGEPDERSSH